MMLAFLSVAITLNYIDSKRIDKLYNEFPKASLNTSFQGKIKELNIERDAIYITLKTRKVLLGPFHNDLYSFRFPEKIISVGDSIVKNSGSDTLYLYHENKKYWFKLLLN